MQLERRDFIKGLLGTLTVAATGLPVVLDEVASTLEIPPPLSIWFDPLKEYGMAWRYTGEHREWSELLPQLRNLLVADARRTLPPGTRFEIRAAPPTDFGRLREIAWYRSPSMDEPDWERPLGWDCPTGVDRIAQVVA